MHNFDAKELRKNKFCALKKSKIKKKYFTSLYLVHGCNI